MYSTGYKDHHQIAALVVSLVCLKNGIKSVPPVPTSVILFFSSSASSIPASLDVAVAIFVLPARSCDGSASLVELVVLFDAMMIYRDTSCMCLSRNEERAKTAEL